MQNNQNHSIEDEFQNPVCSNKHISSYKISWSAFSKVISTSEHAQVFDNLPSLLLIPQNLSNNEEENNQEIKCEKNDKVFQKIYCEVKIAYDAIKTIFKHDGQLHQIFSNRNKLFTSKFQDEMVTE